MTCHGINVRPEEIERQIGSFKSKEYVDFDRLLLLGKLLEAQHRVEKRLSRMEIYPFWDEGAIRERIRKGFPAVDSARICFDGTVLAELLREVREIRIGGSIGRAADQLLSADSSGEIILSEFVEKAISGDPETLQDLCRDLGPNDVEGFNTLALILAAPFLRCCAGALDPALLLESVSSSWCPICGGIPLMARLRQEDGKRLLECSVCSSQWGFERLKCPFCSNEDQSSLGYFFVEEESAYRVDTCEVCKRYIKTVDERKKVDDPPEFLAITDMATLYLDILAEKKNYRAITEADQPLALL